MTTQDTEEKKITVPLCPELPGNGVSIETLEKNGKISVEPPGDDYDEDDPATWGKLVMPIAKNEDADAPEVIIKIALQEDTNEGRAFVYYGDTIDEDWLWWERETYEHRDGSLYIHTYPVIYMMRPDHCQFAGEFLRKCLKLLYHCELHHYSIINTVRPGMIFTLSVTQNTIVPGMKLELEHVFSNGKVTDRFQVDEDWWCTSCITGGEVTAVNGGCDSKSITYQVYIQGHDVTCVSSDFVCYEIGDWVFVYRPSSPCEDEESVDFKAAGELNSINIILPLDINGYGD